LADCNEAVRLTPDDPQARAVRGITHLKMGEYGRAMADFDAALAEVPDDALSLFGRGLAKRGRGDEAGAASDMAAAKAIAADIEIYFVDCGVSI
jgi:tetratricopeptide (TPR) repeat protein